MRADKQRKKSPRGIIDHSWVGTVAKLFPLSCFLSLFFHFLLLASFLFVFFEILLFACTAKESSKYCDDSAAATAALTRDNHSQSITDQVSARRCPFLPGEALERRTLRIYTQRHASRLQLFRNKLVHFLCNIHRERDISCEHRDILMARNGEKSLSN